eukprot:TRINITY_DN5981_c0_g2_i4.p1 TRINITY_DN5981_c0_g2~~TRINITY_DN5981_c0_g2_i4.p1  ORF type:complete len:481 (-),score=67.21 TRINITY_DN5981_c0_g2_i4:315-1757(-)
MDELSTSFKDVCAVIPADIPHDAYLRSPPSNNNLLQLEAISQEESNSKESVRVDSATRFLKQMQGAQNGALEKADRRAVQVDENDEAEVVIVCEPEGTSLMMGGLHPRASLYERPVNLDVAKETHRHFREVLRSHGIKVLTVREILAFGTSDHIGARVDLENLAMEALKYQLAPTFKMEEIDEEDRFYLTDDYKREVLENMSVSQLIDTILITPTVSLAPSFRDTGLTATYAFHPLSNLVYTRDQQVTTVMGIIMGRLRSPQRQMEVKLMNFCFNKLGLPVIGKIVEPGYLEGGDFIPAGLDLAFLGVGLRSNEEAAHQLMSKNLLGTSRFAVVKDQFEQHQDRMHLDCVFSIVGKKVCLMLEDMMGEESPTRRLVDVYVFDPRMQKYNLEIQNREFSLFLKSEGYSIIPIAGQDQREYACNVLNLGNGNIVSVHAKSARQIVRNNNFLGDIKAIDFSSITSMYGAVHCSSQVVRRRHNP